MQSVNTHKVHTLTSFEKVAKTDETIRTSDRRESDLRSCEVTLSSYKQSPE